MPTYARRIADAVHDTIGLTDLEAKILDTQAFQRLRRVKQLGMVSAVFPGADYSRLSHSLGVCHVTGRLLNALRDSGVDIDGREWELYRLAGMLHDIGHYPFSHILEEALENHYKSSLVVRPGETDTPPLERPLDHEGVGQVVLQHDDQVRSLLDAHSIDPAEVQAIFRRQEPPRFANLVSSDLDADRIDYLLRTAWFTGLPYGSVDLEYLLSQLRVDNEERLCFTKKALRTAEHTLLCRYFDYQQVTYHKTVAGLELALKDVLQAMAETNALPRTPADIIDAVRARSWNEFDDNRVSRALQDFHGTTADETLKLKAASIIRRRPPALIGSDEFIGSRDQQTRFNASMALLRVRVNEWAESTGIPRERWLIWSKAGITLTKSGHACRCRQRSNEATTNSISTTATTTRCGYCRRTRRLARSPKNPSR